MALRATGESLHGRSTYVDGYGTRRQCTVCWDGCGKRLATNGYLHATGATKEEAAAAFRERWEDLHG